MAQLPPKVPPMTTQNWPNSFPYQMTMMPSSAAPPSTWFDEFLDFSSLRRSSHRRSASDSIAFIPVADNSIHSNAAGFDGLDDDQLMTMFSDDAAMAAPPPTSSNPSTDPSTTSDQNSNDDEKPKTVLLKDHHQHQPKHEVGEVDSSCNSDAEKSAPPSAAGNNSGDCIVDPKRVKRILANRQSAQRSRVRKLQYISELERSVSSLQTEVSALSPRVAFLDHQRLILNVDNSALKQRIAALAQDKIFKDAHQEALRKEIERLRNVYHQQQNNLKKMENTVTVGAPPPPPPQTSDNSICTDKEQQQHHLH